MPYLALSPTNVQYGRTAGPDHIYGSYVTSSPTLTGGGDLDDDSDASYVTIAGASGGSGFEVEPVDMDFVVPAGVTPTHVAFQVRVKNNPGAIAFTGSDTRRYEYVFMDTSDAFLYTDILYFGANHAALMTNCTVSTPFTVNTFWDEITDPADAGELGDWYDLQYDAPVLAALTGSGLRVSLMLTYFDSTTNPIADFFEFRLLVRYDQPVGQLYVNLSTTETPDWVSVCPEAGSLGNQAQQYPYNLSRHSGYPEKLMDNDDGTYVDLWNDWYPELYLSGNELNSATELWLVVDALVSGDLTFHWVVFPPPNYNSWAVRIEPFTVTANERYVRKIVLSDNWSSSGTWVGNPNYPQTQADQTQWLKDSITNGYTGTGSFLSTHYESIISLKLDGAETAEILVAKFGIFDSASLSGGAAGHFNTNAAGVTWTQVHLGDFYANVATSGAPAWYTCCSHTS